jgi:hypothetical protein
MLHFQRDKRNVLNSITPSAVVADRDRNLITYCHSGIVLNIIHGLLLNADDTNRIRKKGIYT